MSGYTALIGRIQQSLEDLERVIRRVESLMDKTEQTGDDDYLDGVALNLHGFYAGVEHVFEDIAREMEGALPTGPQWHSSLLLQMSAKINSTRPAVITPETRRYLDEYRGFRHVVRNVYTFDLHPNRVLELAHGVRRCYEALTSDLNAFAEFLDKLMDEK